jgi:PAS domain S-box-containing protein
MLTRALSVTARCAVAVSACAAALLMKWLLGPTIMPGVFLPFFGAVLASAWFAGLSGGVLTTVLSAVAATALFLPPMYPPHGPGAVTDVRVVLFMLFGVGLSWVVAQTRRARDELSLRVGERTAALSAANDSLRAQIAESQQTAAALRASEERYALAVAGANDGLWDWNLENDQVYFSPRCKTMLGFDGDSARADDWHEWRARLHPDDYESVVRDLTAHLKGETPYYENEQRLRHEDGTYRWVLSRGVCLRDASGRAYRMAGSNSDITRRKHAEELLRHAYDEMEARVRERTAALSEANRLLHEAIAIHRTTDDALRESERRFRAIFDQAAVGVALTGLDGRWLLVNQRFCEMLGYERDELLQRTFVDVTHPADLESSLASMHRHLAGEVRVDTMEKRYLRKDGSTVWVTRSVTLIRDSADRPLHGVVVIEDITERRRAQQELTKLNQRMRNLLESITDGFFAVDQRGRFTYLNPRAAQLLQRTREELIGKNVWEEFPEAVGSTFYEQSRRALTERTPVVAEGYYGPLHRWFKTRAYPSQEGVAVLFEDITEEHAHEVTVVSDILRALNARVDVAGAFPEVGAGLRALTGCDISSLILIDEGNEWGTLVGLDQPHVDLSGGVRIPFSGRPDLPELLEGEPLVSDLAAEAASSRGRKIYHAGYRSLVTLPLRGDDRVFGVIDLLWRRADAANFAQLPLLRHVADAVALAVQRNHLFEQVRAGRARLEILSQRLLEVQEAERRRIARELHDEVGQGLTGLKLVLDGVDRIPLDAARAQLRDMQELVNELLTRIRDLSLDLRPGMLDDLGLLPALLWLFGRYSAQTNVHVAFEHSGLDRRFSPEVETAAYRIVQEALTNVARHAGVRRATVRAWADARTVTVQVADEGSGFDPSVALAGATSSGVMGMRERAGLLGGQLTLESAPGAGTRLCAEFPLNNGWEETRDGHHDSPGR